MENMKTYRDCRNGVAAFDGRVCPVENLVNEGAEGKNVRFWAERLSPHDLHRIGKLLKTTAHPV